MRRAADKANAFAALTDRCSSAYELSVLPMELTEMLCVVLPMELTKMLCFVVIGPV